MTVPRRFDSRTGRRASAPGPGFAKESPTPAAPPLVVKVRSFRERDEALVLRDGQVALDTASSPASMSSWISPRKSSQAPSQRPNDRATSSAL